MFADIWHRNRLFIINCFIIFHLFALIPWALPGDALWFARLRRTAEPYMLWSGLWQKWDMFSPDPLKLNAWLSAEVVYPGGETKTFEFPRMENLGETQKFLQERFRKWASERVRVDENSMLWPDTSRWVARQHWNDGSGPPLEVHLIRHFSTLPAPETQFVKIGEENKIKEYDYTFYRYTVKMSDAPKDDQ